MESEIILIGNELLIGKIQDTNGQLFIKEFLNHGQQISRITVIPDIVDIIAQTVQDSISRKPLFILLSGGLGPTYDDLTNEGLAKAFNVPLIANKDAMTFLKTRYKKLYESGKTNTIELNESRLKMGMLPSNAIALKNSSGAAPGVYIKLKHEKGVTKLIAMPGFPDEVKAIFYDHIVPMLEKTKSHYYHAGIKFEDVGESTLAADIVLLRQKYPNIWIKTHPTKTKNSDKIFSEIHLTSFLDTDDNKENGNLEEEIINLRKECENIIIKYNGTITEIY